MKQSSCNEKSPSGLLVGKQETGSNVWRNLLKMLGNWGHQSNSTWTGDRWRVSTKQTVLEMTVRQQISVFSHSVWGLGEMGTKLISERLWHFFLGEYWWVKGLVSFFDLVALLCSVVSNPLMIYLLIPVLRNFAFKFAIIKCLFFSNSVNNVLQLNTFAYKTVPWCLGVTLSSPTT